MVDRDILYLLRRGGHPVDHGNVTMSDTFTPASFDYGCGTHVMRNCRTPARKHSPIGKRLFRFVGNEDLFLDRPRDKCPNEKDT
jgi:hypothetical protein